MALTKYIFIILSLFLVACHKSDKGTQVKVAEHDLTRASFDVELPTALWDKIDSVYKNDSKEKKEGEGGSDPMFDELSKEYVPLTVHLIEKSDNKGILQNEDHRLFFGAGGGMIDLADYVENRKGSYYLKIEFGKGKPDDAVEETVSKGGAKEGSKDGEKDFSKEKLRVFYLGNARRRKWNGTIIGSGCYKYFDISKFYEKSMSGPGFLLNTTDHLDVTSVSGSFFFAAQINKTLYISQLSIKDSRFNSLQCRPLGKVESL